MPTFTNIIDTAASNVKTEYMKILSARLRPPLDHHRSCKSPEVIKLLGLLLNGCAREQNSLLSEHSQTGLVAATLTTYIL